MSIRILIGDCRDRLRDLPEASVQCVVTSPPYFGLRDYGHDGQIGLEPTPDEFVAAMVEVFREVRRVLRDDGTLFLNLGDSYGPGKQKLLMPARVALALQADGWILRQDNVWAKKRPMPESVADRSTCAHEFVFHFAKTPAYFYDAEGVRQPLAESSLSRLSQNVEGQAGSARAAGGAKTNGPMRAVARQTGKQVGHSRRHSGFNERWDAAAASGQMASGANLRSVWHLAPPNFTDAHFATMPTALAETCIKAGSKPGDMVLDPFGGAGTTGLVADQLGRDCTLIELNPEYADMARRRIERDGGMFSQVEIAA